MAEFQRVPLRPRPDRNWLPTAGLALAIFLALAIVKPWDASRPGTAGGPTAGPTFFIRPTERTGPREYDPRLFGGREPDPAWELWPAGFVVQFGLAGPVKVGEGAASPEPGASAAAGESGAPPPSLPVGASAGPPGPSGPPASELPLGSGAVDIGTADHLVALGINTPLDARVETVRLFFLTGSRSDMVETVRLPTLWESSHFLVIAPADRAAPGQPAAWRPGRYRLELTTAFGDIRLVELLVRPPGATSN
jgi:hypothetical protein